MTIPSVPELLALERNLRRAGFKSAAMRLADHALREPCGFFRFDGGRAVRIAPDDETGQWKAWWVRTEKPALLIATDTHALVDRQPPPPKRADRQVGVRFDPTTIALLDAVAHNEHRSLSSIVVDAVEQWLQAREVAHVTAAQ